MPALSHPRHASDNPRPPAPRFQHFRAPFCRNCGVGREAGGRRAVGRGPGIAGQGPAAAGRTGSRTPAPAGFSGYSSTFKETPSRPGFTARVSAGQSVAGSRSTRQVPKSARISVETREEDWARRPPCRPAPFRAVPQPLRARRPPLATPLAPVPPRPARRSLRYSGRNCSKNQIISRY